MAGILITGGTGRLGSVLVKSIPCAAPSHAEMPIDDAGKCVDVIAHYDPEIIIHCAAYADTQACQFSRTDAWRINVIGTKNMVRAARGRRFVYVSTDYVFAGDQGMYREADVPAPLNYYGITKLVGELIALEHANTLVLRAPFRAGPPWPYERAFTDQWTSSRFASEVVPDVIASAQMPLCGILHLGGNRRAIYEMAKSATPSVGMMLRKEITVPLPEDVSLDSSKWHFLSAR
jgi:dTDP-4-dehydrorhamnose reductase